MSPGREAQASRLPLVEREAEAARIRAAVDAACAGRGSTLLITADPGIGKTVLLRHALDHASDGTFAVLKADAREFEQQYPYGVVLQLFERIVAEQPDDNVLSGAASLAARLFSPNDQPAETDAPAEPFPILHGLYWLVANLAEQGPLVIGIDDAHWTDIASLRFIHYLTQRLDDLPICLLLTARPAWSWPPELRQLADAASTESVQLPGLSLAAVEELVAANGLDQTDALARDVWHATRGNPFFISELLRHVASGGGDARGIVASETLTRWVLARIERAGPAGRRTAEALAVLGGAAPLPALAALAGLAHEPVRDAVAGLVDRGIVQANGEVAFVHPIVQDCVYDSIQPVRRGEMHLAAAQAAAVDPAEIDAAAVHLLSAPHSGEAWIVDLLATAAQRALDRAAPETAADYLQRALAEPPGIERRTELLQSLAAAESATGNAIAAAEHLEAALALSTDVFERASILYRLGQARLGSALWDAALGDFQRGIDELTGAGEGADALRAELRAGRNAARIMSMQGRDSMAQELAEMLSTPRLPASARHLAASVGFGAAAQAASPARQQIELIQRSLAGATIEELLDSGQTVELSAGVLLAADDLEADVAMLTAAIEAAQRAGHYAKFCAVSYCRSWPNVFRARLAEAVTDGQAATGGLDRGWEMFYPAAASALAMAHIERDNLDEAERALQMDQRRWSEALDYRFLVPSVRGRLLEARGEIDAAIRVYREADAVARAAGIINTGIILPSAPRLAILLARSGNHDEASALIGEQLDIARRWEAPRFLGMVLRAAGLVEGGEPGMALVRESVTVLETSPSKLELIRSMLSLGAGLRRGGRLTEARDWLRRTIDAAHHTGARLLERQAAEELRLAGARPRRYQLTGVGALTPAELRVASMAAEGRTNREVAQALFVTTKAVEYHLGNAYRKLGIGSRAELASVLGGEQAQSLVAG
jgi:DNA-binding CsgD family transcriptional regulator